MTENKKPFDEMLVRKKLWMLAAAAAALITFRCCGKLVAYSFASNVDDATAPKSTLPILGIKTTTQSLLDFSVHACSVGDSSTSSRFKKQPTSWGKNGGFYEACGFHLLGLHDGDDMDELSKKDMIKILKKFKKEEFYPPLIILDLGNIDANLKWLNSFRTVFPNYVIAIQVAEGALYDPDFVKEQELSGFDPISIFPLRSNNNNNGNTNFAKDVLAILDYYNEQLAPSRKVNLYANVFTDETIRIPAKVPETMTQVREHAEPRTKRIRRTERGERKTRYETGRCLYPEVEETISRLQHLGLYPKWVSRLVDSMMYSETTRLGDLLGVECVPETKEETIMVENKVSEKYRYDTVREYEDTLERDVVEMWHGLADGTFYFLGKETSPWRIVGTKLLQEEETQPVLTKDED